MFALDRLRALDALARTGSVTRAAADLHLTPSAVSQQLDRLDAEARVVLTERDGRVLRLTPAGRLLAGHAADVLARLRRARAELEQLHDDAVGTVRVGAIPSSVQALAPEAMRRLRVAHPDLRVTVADGELQDTLVAVEAGELDVAVVDNWPDLPAPIPPRTDRAVLVGDDVIDLVLPVDHRLAGRSRVALAEVDDIEWVIDRPGNSGHDWMLQTLRAHGVEPAVTAQVCGWGMHLDLVAGAGVAALVPRLALARPPAGVRAVPTDPEMRRTIDAVWRADSGTPAVRAVVAALRDVATELAAAAQDPGGSRTSASKQV